MTIATGECLECGHPYAREVSPRRVMFVKYCTRRCSMRANSRRARHERRQIIQAQPRDIIHTRELAERDAWICWVCERVVDATNWSIDHVLPISAGGTHQWTNVRLAHWLCNVRRNTDGHAPMRATPTGLAPLMRECLACQSAFETSSPQVRYCSSGCLHDQKIAAQRKRRSEHRAANPPRERPPSLRCKKGHLYAEVGVHLIRQGDRTARECRLCYRVRRREMKRALRTAGRKT